MTISVRMRLLGLVSSLSVIVMLMAACTPEGEVDLQQVQGVAETAEAVSAALERATIQAEELASLRATVDAESPEPTVTPTGIPVPTAHRP